MRTLAERMARAAVAHDSGPEGSELFAIHWAEFGESYTSLAKSMLSLAMDEAADRIESRANLSMESVNKYIRVIAREIREIGR